jgi:hypothetical protein
MCPETTDHESHKRRMAIIESGTLTSGLVQHHCTHLCGIFRRCHRSVAQTLLATTRSTMSCIAGSFNSNDTSCQEQHSSSNCLRPRPRSAQDSCCCRGRDRDRSLHQSPKHTLCPKRRSTQAFITSKTTVGPLLGQFESSFAGIDLTIQPCPRTTSADPGLDPFSSKPSNLISVSCIPNF